MMKKCWDLTESQCFNSLFSSHDTALWANLTSFISNTPNINLYSTSGDCSQPSIKNWAAKKRWEKVEFSQNYTVLYTPFLITIQWFGHTLPTQYLALQTTNLHAITSDCLQSFIQSVVAKIMVKTWWDVPESKWFLIIIFKWWASKLANLTSFTHHTPNDQSPPGLKYGR